MAEETEPIEEPPAPAATPARTHAAASSATEKFLVDSGLAAKTDEPPAAKTDEPPAATGDEPPPETAATETPEQLEERRLADPFAGLKDEAIPEVVEEPPKDALPQPGKDFPQGAKQWKDWRAKETVKLQEEYAARYQNDRFAQLETVRSENVKLQETLAQTQDKLEKVAFTETQKYTDNFIRPKEEAIATVEAVVQGSGPEALGVAASLVGMMKAGTLTPANFPDVSSLNDLQRGAISQAVTGWMSANRGEQSALDNWQQHREQYLSESRDMETQSRQAAVQTMGEQLRSLAAAAIPDLEKSLPGGYTEEDRTAAARLLSAENAQAYMGKAVMAVPALTRQLRDSILRERDLESKMAEIETERDELQDALSSYSSASRTSGAGSGAGTPAPSKERPKDRFIRELNERRS